MPERCSCCTCCYRARLAMASPLARARSVFASASHKVCCESGRTPGARAGAVLWQRAPTQNWGRARWRRCDHTLPRCFLISRVRCAWHARAASRMSEDVRVRGVAGARRAHRALDRCEIRPPRAVRCCVGEPRGGGVFTPRLCVWIILDCNRRI